jgi:hypothetical protein
MFCPYLVLLYKLTVYCLTILIVPTDKNSNHGFNYLCTCDLYSPVHNVLDGCITAYTLRGEVGGDWALEFPSFLGPVKWERADFNYGPYVPVLLPHAFS